MGVLSLRVVLLNKDDHHFFKALPSVVTARAEALFWQSSSAFATIVLHMSLALHLLPVHLEDTYSLSATDEVCINMQYSWCWGICLAHV